MTRFFKNFVARQKCVDCKNERIDGSFFDNLHALYLYTKQSFRSNTDFALDPSTTVMQKQPS